MEKVRGRLRSLLIQVGPAAPGIATLVTASAFLWMFFGNQAVLDRLCREDGPIEWTQVACYLAAAALLVAGGLRRRSSKLWAWPFLCLFIFVAGDELSWGQRIFSVNTPEEFAHLNRQQEMNLHNLRGVQAPMRLAAIAFAQIVFFVVPILNSTAPKAKALFAATDFPVYPYWAWPLPLAGVLFAVMPRLVAGDTDRSLGELAELYIGLAFALWASPLIMRDSPTGATLTTAPAQSAPEP